MTERNTSSERLSEHDVDRLLQQFFHDEVPAEFRRDEPVLTLAKPVGKPSIRTTRSDSSRSLAGLLGILVSATCCLIVTIFIPGAPDEQDSLSAPPTIGEIDRNHKPVKDDTSVPVEERSHLRYTTTKDQETQPASESEKTGPLEPELEIEIFPLRPDKPRE